MKKYRYNYIHVRFKKQGVTDIKEARRLKFVERFNNLFGVETKNKKDEKCLK